MEVKLHLIWMKLTFISKAHEINEAYKQGKYMKHG